MSLFLFIRWLILHGPCYLASMVGRVAFAAVALPLSGVIYGLALLFSGGGR